MEILALVQAANVIFMDWKMTMSFRKSPDTPIFGATRLVSSRTAESLNNGIITIYGVIY